MNILKQIPNTFTLGNLVCGVLSILSIFEGNQEQAVYLILLAAVLDFFDGFLARLFKVSGELGKQLDSLADLVTFGVAPAFMLYSLSDSIEGYSRYFFLMPAVFSAYRLAKFNLDTRSGTSFYGVPTPITGIMIVSWVFVDMEFKELLFENQFYFVLFCVLVSYLLVSEIKLPSLKIKKGSSDSYTQHIILLAVGIVSVIFFKWLCVPIFYATYVLSSILFNFARKKSK
jgi:CDP-diacylglycerol--serine O-phosphatidyltransferase